MSRRSRVLLWCLLAGCAGGPISDFPKGAGGGDNAGKGPMGGEDDDENSSDPPGSDEGDGDSVDDPDNGLPGPIFSGDAGAEPEAPQRPCASDPNGPPDEGPTDEEPADAGVPDGGQCDGDVCPITRAHLDMILAAPGACSTPAEKSLVCDAQVQRTIGRCNELSLAESASFDLVENCALTEPALADVGEACIDCYLEANRCTLLNCLAECITPSADEACRLCRANQCGAALSACTGLPLL